MKESWERGSSFPDLLPRVIGATLPELLRECTQVSLIHVQRGEIFMLGAREKCPHVIFMQMKGCFSIFPPTQCIPVLLGKFRLPPLYKQALAHFQNPLLMPTQRCPSDFHPAHAPSLLLSQQSQTFAPFPLPPGCMDKLPPPTLC